MIGPTLVDLAEALASVGVLWLEARREWLASPPAPEPPALRVTPLVRLSSLEHPMPRTVFRVEADLRPVPPGLPAGRVARQLLRLLVDGIDYDEVEVPLGTPTFEIEDRFEVGEQLTVLARYESAAGIPGPEAEARLDPFAEAGDGGGGGDPTPPPAHPGLTLRVTPETMEDQQVEDEDEDPGAAGAGGAGGGGAGPGAGGAGGAGGSGPATP